jgi:hypothetical protein
VNGALKHYPSTQDGKFKATTQDQLIKATTWGTMSFFGYLFPDSISISKRGRGMCVCAECVCVYVTVRMFVCVYGGMH